MKAKIPMGLFKSFKAHVSVCVCDDDDKIRMKLLQA